MKRIISLLLIFCLLIGYCPSSVFAAENDDTADPLAPIETPAAKIEDVLDSTPAMVPEESDAEIISYSDDAEDSIVPDETAPSIEEEPPAEESASANSGESEDAETVTAAQILSMIEALPSPEAFSEAVSNERTSILEQAAAIRAAFSALSEEERERVDLSSLEAIEALSEKAVQAISHRIAALVSVEAFADAAPTDRDNILNEIASIRQRIRTLAAQEQNKLDTAKLDAIEASSRDAVQAVQSLIDALAELMQAGEDPQAKEAEIQNAYDSLGETEQALLDFSALTDMQEVSDGLTNHKTVRGIPTLPLLPHSQLFFQFENGSPFEETRYTSSMLLSGTNSDGTASATAELTAICDKTEEYLNVDDCLFTFTRPENETQGNRFYIKAANSNLYLNFDDTNWDNGRIFSESHRIFSLDADENTINGCFRLGDTVKGRFLYCYKVPHGNVKATFFVGSPNYLSDDNKSRCSVMILKPTDDSSEQLIPGYALVSSTEDIVSGEKYLIASAAANAIYVVHPAAVSDNPAVNAAKLTTKVTVTSTASTNRVSSVSIGNLVCSVLTLGFPTATAAVESRTVDVKLSLGEEKTFQDFTGSYTFTDEEQNAAAAITVTSRIGSNPELLFNGTRDDSLNTAAAAVYHLSDCVYGLVAYNDENRSRFLITGKTSDGKRVFLNINGAMNNGSGYPNSSIPDPISFGENSDGTFRIFDTQGEGNYTYSTLSTSGDVYFSRKTGIKDSNTITDKFYIFQYRDGSFFQVTRMRELVDGGKYIFAYSENGQDVYVLHPSDSTENVYAHSAYVVRPDSEEALNDSFRFATATNVTIRAMKNGDRKNVTIGSTTYNISVVENQNYTPQPKTYGDRTYSISAGETKVLSKIPIYFTSENMDWDSFQEDTIEIVAFDSQQNYETYANRHKIRDNGTPTGYVGAELPISECLFTFSGSADNCTLNANGIYVQVDDVNPGDSKSHTIALESSGTGFHIKENGQYLAFRRNGWGVFFVNSSSTEADRLFQLYTPDPNSDSHSSFPGYRRITSAGDLTEGMKLVIAALYDNHYYILNPAVSTNRNDHVVMANGWYSSGTTVVTVKGLSKGVTNADIKDSNGTHLLTLSIRVTDKLTQLTPGAIISKVGKANGQILNKLTISAGSTYTIAPAPGHTAVSWISNDEHAISIENGVLTVYPGAVGSSGYLRTYVGYLDENGNKYATEIVIVNTYSGTKGGVWDLYTLEIEETDVFYAWCEQGKVYSKDDLRQISEKEHLYLTMDSSQSAINFFAKAHDGYALTFMNAPGSAGEYKSLLPTDAQKQQYAGQKFPAKETAFYKEGAARNQDTYKCVESMIQCAMDELGCTGAMGFSSTYGCTLSFTSDKLPTLEKKVLAISPLGNNDAVKNPIQYQDGMRIYEGDVIHFMVTVKSFAPLHADVTKEYSDVILLDNLPNAHVVGYSINRSDNEIIYTDTDTVFKQLQVHTETRSTDTYLALNLTELINTHCTGNTPSNLKLYIDYTVTAQDVAKVGAGHNLFNEAILSYNYKSAYDAGFLGSEAHAKAILTLGLHGFMKFVNLSLTGSIGVNVYLGAAAAANTPAALANEQFDEHYFDAWKTNKSSLVMQLGDSGNTVVTELSTGTPAAVDGTVCSVFTIPVAPQDITTDIHLYIQNKAEERVTEILTFTVQDYAAVILNNQEQLIHTWMRNSVPFYYADESYNHLSALVKAMLNYGAYTQKYLNHHTENLANRILAETDRALATENVSISNGDGFSVNNNPNSGITFTGMGLELNPGSLGLRIYFTADEKIDIKRLKAKSEYIAQGYTGTLYKYAYAAGIAIDESGYYIRLSNIDSQWMNNVFRITISNGTESSWVEISALTYVYLIQQDKAQVSSELVDMTSAMYRYNMAAQDYFGTYYPTQDPGDAVNA